MIEVHCQEIVKVNNWRCYQFSTRLFVSQIMPCPEDLFSRPLCRRPCQRRQRCCRGRWTSPSPQCSTPRSYSIVLDRWHVLGSGRSRWPTSRRRPNVWERTRSRWPRKLNLCSRAKDCGVLQSLSGTRVKNSKLGILIVASNSKENLKLRPLKVLFASYNTFKAKGTLSALVDCNVLKARLLFYPCGRP